MHKSLPVFAIAALLACTSLHAQQLTNKSGLRYRWVDAKGLPHFSDSLTSDAIKFGYDVVNDQGLVVQHVQRQLSPAERAAALKQAQQQADAQRAAREQTLADEQMLSSYPDEAAYKASLQQVLAGIDQEIHTSKLNLRSQEQALTDLLARAAEAEHAKQPVPKTLLDAIAKQRAVVNEVGTELQRQQAKHAQAEQLQVQQLAHYRALKAAEAQQDQP